MSKAQRPVLYSFRRCPYAMRARMALVGSGQTCELREVVLRNKPEDMIEASPKATVPVLITPDGNVRDESLDIMLWALDQNDPDGWYAPQISDKATMLALITRIDGPFKSHLDGYKYAPRPSRKKPDIDPDAIAKGMEHRDAALPYLEDLDGMLADHPYLFGNRIALADVAIAPFIRQFAHVDINWFNSLPLPRLQSWLQRFQQSDLFEGIMAKYEPWESGTVGVGFPMPAQSVGHDPSERT